MTPVPNIAQIVAQLQRQGIELFIGSKPGKVRICSRGKLPKDARCPASKEEVISYLNEPATPEELEAVARSGRRPSPLLTHSEARELSFLPPPVPPTVWQLALDGFYHGSLRPWEKLPASKAQLAFLQSHKVEVPADATKGECSFVIGMLKNSGGFW